MTTTTTVVLVMMVQWRRTWSVVLEYAGATGKLSKTQLSNVTSNIKLPLWTKAVRIVKSFHPKFSWPWQKVKGLLLLSTWHLGSLEALQRLISSGGIMSSSCHFELQWVWWWTHPRIFAIVERSANSTWSPGPTGPCCESPIRFRQKNKGCCWHNANKQFACEFFKLQTSWWYGWTFPLRVIWSTALPRLWPKHLSLAASQETHPQCISTILSVYCQNTPESCIYNLTIKYQIIICFIPKKLVYSYI